MGGYNLCISAGFAEVHCIYVGRKLRVQSCNHVNCAGLRQLQL